MIGTTIKKAFYYLKKNGIQDTIYASCEQLSGVSRMQYRYVEISEKEAAFQSQFSFSHEIFFSILVPMYETNEAYAKAMIQSVLGQTYSNFELILADASSSDKVKKTVDSFADERIKYFRIAENKGISVNTNEALKRARGDYIALLDHDDLLTRDALFYMAKAIYEGMEQDITYAYLYSDEDKCDSEAVTFYDPNIKPDFNLDLLLSNNYICHFLVMKAELIKELSFRQEFDGAQDYDLVLRAYAKKDTKQEIGHVDRVLYHWRCHEASTAANPQSKLYAYEAGKNAVQDFLNHMKIEAFVEHTKHNGFYRVQYGKDGLSKQETAEAVFEKRSDVGVLAGNVYKGNKIVSGILDANGICIYKGLNRHFSGYLHRAHMQQDCEAADIRNLAVREELRPILNEMLQSEKPTDEESRIKFSMLFCEEVGKRGYRILWDPFF